MPTEVRSLVEMPLSLAEDVELRASRYYEQGFHCAESVVKAVVELLVDEPADGATGAAALTPDAVRMASGFCAGLGGSRCICGALAGGVMALGLLKGRTRACDAWEPSYYAAAELRRRWIEDQDAETCDEVVNRIGDMNDPARWAHCTRLVGRTARWVAEMAADGTAF